MVWLSRSPLSLLVDLTSTRCPAGRTDEAFTPAASSDRTLSRSTVISERGRSAASRRRFSARIRSSTLERPSPMTLGARRRTVSTSRPSRNSSRYMSPGIWRSISRLRSKRPALRRARASVRSSRTRPVTPAPPLVPVAGLTTQSPPAASMNSSPAAASWQSISR